MYAIGHKRRFCTTHSSFDDENKNELGTKYMISNRTMHTTIAPVLKQGIKKPKLFITRKTSETSYYFVLFIVIPWFNYHPSKSVLAQCLCPRLNLGPLRSYCLWLINNEVRNTFDTCACFWSISDNLSRYFWKDWLDKEDFHQIFFFGDAWKTESKVVGRSSFLKKNWNNQSVVKIGDNKHRNFCLTDT